MNSYIDVGDRVVVTENISNKEHARIPYPGAVGKHGEVIMNDGWGFCRIKLDDGSELYAWNGCDLVRE